jgi:NB-ARC domain
MTTRAFVSVLRGVCCEVPHTERSHRTHNCVWPREKRKVNRTPRARSAANPLISVRTRSGSTSPREPPDDFVQRPVEFSELKKKLLDAKGDAIAITAALRGAGGYGKTTLAKALAHDPDVKDAYFDGILWVELGEKPRNLLSIISDLVEILSGERSGLQNINSPRGFQLKPASVRRNARRYGTPRDPTFARAPRLLALGWPHPTAGIRNSLGLRAGRTGSGPLPASARGLSRGLRLTGRRRFISHLWGDDLAQR